MLQQSPLLLVFCQLLLRLFVQLILLIALVLQLPDLCLVQGLERR